MRPRAWALCLLLLSACYLPGQDVDRPLENQVQITVRECTADLVAGEIENDADVAITVELIPKWLDTASQVYHTVEVTTEPVPPGELVRWEAPAGESIDPPLLCQAEIVRVSRA